METFKPSSDFRLENSLFGAVKLTKKFDFDKYKYFGYGIGIDVNGVFLLHDRSRFGEKIIIFGVDMSSSVHNDSKKNIS